MRTSKKNSFVWFGLFPRATRPGWEWAWMSQTCLLVSLKSATKFNKFIVTICTYLKLAPFNPIRSWLNCSPYPQNSSFLGKAKQCHTSPWPAVPYWPYYKKPLLDWHNWLPKADAGLTFPTNPAFRHYLKGQCHKIFAFIFFHESVSPKPLSIQLGLFFWKFAEIFAAQGAPQVSLTPVAYGKNLQSEKF
jgi:hypothetical protein